MHHLFLANSISFVLNRAANADLASLLRDEWVACAASDGRSHLERHAESYVEASWAPVVVCLGDDQRQAGESVGKFNAAFKKAHGSQVWRGVPDPALRAALRKAVAEKHLKVEKSVSYSG